LIKPHLLVAHIATLNGVIAINQSSTIEYARSVLDVNGIGILPIVDDLGRLVGVVTRQDLDLYI
jgi:CBS domain-containing protein